MHARFRPSVVLNRLDGFSPWTFTGALYLARWLIILPVAWALGLLGASNNKMTFQVSAIEGFIGFIFLAPLLETVLECVVPYWLMLKTRRITPGKRPWAFVILSATLMALLHLSAWPAALVPSLVTGTFLAYTYGHFAVCGVGQAILHTSVFHAAINIVGWLLIFTF